MRKTISKHTRKLVYAKCNGHCGYCGSELEYKDMQIDHINSVRVAEWRNEDVDESIDNYMPACRQCNFYKSTMSVEAFRERLKDTMFANLKKNFNYRLALKYGLISENDAPIEFYFENMV